MTRHGSDNWMNWVSEHPTSSFLVLLAALAVVTAALMYVMVSP